MAPTSTNGSVIVLEKFCTVTTSAADTLRCAVPNSITPRLPASRPAQQEADQ